MKSIIAALVLISSFVATAETNKIVSIDAFDLSYTGGLMIKSDNAKKGTNRTATEFKFNLNYAQDLNNVDGLMIKGMAFFNREKSKWGTETLESNLGAAAGLLYNFDPTDVKNSFFAAGLAGLEKSKMEGRGCSRKSGVNLFLINEAGKRWDLGRYSVVNISYAPTVSFEYTRYGGAIRKNYFTSGTELKFNFLKFDVLF
jgi:hypothetical protein